MTNLITVTANDGRKVKMTAAQAKAVQTLNASRRGGCAAVKGYVPTSNWKVSPVQDIQLLTNFSTEKLYKRRLEALKAIQFSDIVDKVSGDEKLKNMTIPALKEIFDARKATLIESLERSLDGDRSDAHREAHDRCYVHIGDVKLHLDTEKVDGRMEPVVDADGAVLVKTVMVKYLELNVKTVKEGVRKVVNSGAPVRMEKLIESCLNKRSVGFKTLSLKEDNFEEFKIDNRTIEPGEIEDFRDLLLG